MSFHVYEYRTDRKFILLFSLVGRFCITVPVTLSLAGPLVCSSRTSSTCLCQSSHFRTLIVAVCLNCSSALPTTVSTPISLRRPFLHARHNSNFSDMLKLKAILLHNLYFYKLSIYKRA